MTRDYIKAHVVTMLRAFDIPPKEVVVDIITDKLVTHPRLAGANGDPASEFALGEGCRFYVEQVKKIMERAGER